MLTHLDWPTNPEGFDTQIQQTLEQIVHRHVGLGRGEQRPAALLGEVMKQVGGRGGFPGAGRALNEGQATTQSGFDGRLLRGIEVLVRGKWSALEALAPYVGREFGALVDVEDVAKDEFAKDRAAITLGGMESNEGFMHAIMSNSVRSSVEPPTAFANIARSFADHHTNAGGPSVEHDPFNHLLPPRTRA